MCERLMAYDTSYYEKLTHEEHVVSFDFDKIIADHRSQSNSLADLFAHHYHASHLK
jgi:hypothetical protein